jgi:O-antigen polymerase
MHIALPSPGGAGLYMSYNVFAWIITTLFIALGVWQITLNKKVYYSPLLIWLFFGVIALIIPVFYTFEFTDHAIPRLLALVAGFLFLCCLYQFTLSKQQGHQLLLLILVAVIIQTSFGLIQFFILDTGDWGGYIVGKHRPHGSFTQPNVMASFVATGLAIALFLSVQKPFSPYHKVLQGLLLICSFTFSFLLVLLQSRTGFVGAIFAVLLLIPLLYTHNKRRLLLHMVVILVAVSCASVSLVNSSIPIRSQHIYQEMGVRHNIVVVSADMIQQKPIIGYGYGGFERSFLDHFNQYSLKNPTIGNTPQNFSHPHNEVLFWVVEGGVIALVAFVLFTVGFLLTWRKIVLQKGLALLALIFPILLHSQLELPFYSSVSHWLVFLILLWLMDSYAVKQGEHFNAIECAKTFFLRFWAVFLPLIFLPFLLTTLHTGNILVKTQQNPDYSIAHLTDIVNPVAWKGYVDFIAYTHIFRDGLRTKNPQQLTRYLDWSLKCLRHKPRIELYENSLLVLKTLNKTTTYNKLLVEAKQTYPQKKSWQVTDLTE